MAGTLNGLGLSQQHDINGAPMSGALLYLYEANSSNPVTAYSSPALTAGLELPWPIVADSAGRIPSFWLDDGAYRARLTDAQGVVQFDETNIIALGAGGGDITVPSTPDAAIFTTGDVCWRPVNTTKSGWVRLNGRTMGSATSGASERANADTQSLFEFLYANFTDTLCPVSGGRTGVAVNDFNSGKTITLLDMRGKAPFGVDDMGNSAAGSFSGVTFDAGNATTGGAKGGDATHTLTIAQMPAHDHPGGNTSTNGDHVHQINLGFNVGGNAEAAETAAPGAAQDDTESAGNHAHTLNVASQGGGAAHPTISPFMLGTWYMRL